MESVAVLNIERLSELRSSLRAMLGFKEYEKQ